MSLNLNIHKPILKKEYKFFLKLTIVLPVALLILIYGYEFLTPKNKGICEKCNVILVSLDTLSALHLPCYGYQRNTAPNLCSFASKNLFFINSYSQAPITVRSHFSIFTSLYPHTHKMSVLNNSELDEKYLTLAQLLRSNGYQTIYVGPTNDSQLPLERGIGRGFNIIEGEPSEGFYKWENGLARLLANNKKGQPTFLFLHTYLVHDPYLTGHKVKHIFTDHHEYSNIALTRKEFDSPFSPEFFNFVKEKIIGTGNRFKFNNLTSDQKIAQEINNSKSLNEKINLYSKLSTQAQELFKIFWYESRINKFNSDEVEYYKALYDEQIYGLDGNLTKLFNFLNNPQIANNTILIITADHGEEFMEHNFVGHGNNLYETSIRVPLIIHVPKIQPKKITNMAQSIDIYPTVIGLTGLKPKSKLEGIDLTGVINKANNPGKNSFLLSEWMDKSALQVENLRFYYSNKSNQVDEIYDTAKDINERKNLLLTDPQRKNDFMNILKDKGAGFLKLAN